MKETVHIIQAPPLWLKTPPLSLAFLKSYLQSKKINTKLINLNQTIFKALSPDPKKWLTLDRMWEKNLFPLIKNNYPYLIEEVCKAVKESTYVGFTLFERNLNFSMSLAEEIKSSYPDKKIVFGGPQTLFLDKTNKLNKRDYWVIGEGEIPLEKIIKNSPDKKIYRFRQIKNLDSLPFFDCDFLAEPGFWRQIPLFASRGCRYRCSFCTESLLYKGFRAHSPRYITDQIRYLCNKYKNNSFIFSDSYFNHNHKWLENFCKLILKNKLNIKWEAQFRVDKNLPLSLAKLIKKSGCYNLFIGLESGSNKILKLMNKKFTREDATSFFKTLKQAGLHFEASLIFGYPNETRKDFKETLHFIKKNKNIIPKIAQANPFVDYLSCFKGIKNSSENKKEKIDEFLQFIQSEKIPYTKHFINNLTYSNGNKINKNRKSPGLNAN